MLTKKAIFCLLASIFLSILSANSVFANGFLTLPFEGDFALKCGFGGRNCPAYSTHTGSDYLMLKGSPIVAADDGSATAFLDPASPPSYGNRIDIDHGNGRKTRYAHLSSFASGITASGGATKVYKGQVIGYSGATGGPWDQGNGTWSSPEHLHFEALINGVAVDPYDEDNWLWTTNPPEHGYCNLLSFDFPSHSSQGFTCGYDTEVGAQDNDLNTWQVHITGINPGVVSPSFSCGLMAKDTVIKFRVRALGNDYSGKALMGLSPIPRYE